MIKGLGYSEEKYLSKALRNKGRFFDDIDDVAEKFVTKPNKNRGKNTELPGRECFGTFQPSNFVVLPKQKRLERKGFGYGVEESSALPLYEGPQNKADGLSTQSGGYGGGWLKADMNVPLSTCDVHTCAAVHLVNDETGEQFLHHVHHDSTYPQVEEFLREKFKDFNRVNIVAGDQPKTQNTTNVILAAINKLNPKARINHFHFPTKAPEIVAHQGELSYLPAQKDGSMAFKELPQYDNIISGTF